MARYEGKSQPSSPGPRLEILPSLRVPNRSGDSGFEAIDRALRLRSASKERSQTGPGLLSSSSMMLIKTYGTVLDAELASAQLRAEGIESIVVGVGVAMEGGAEGVRLLVPDDQVDAALEVLGET